MSGDRVNNIAMIVLGVLAVVGAGAIPGYTTWQIIFGAVLAAWASFGLLTED